VKAGGLALVLAALLAGCSSTRLAPVSERTPGPLGSPSSTQPSTSQPPAAKPAASVPIPAADGGAETYTVRRGDTLYGIALDNGQDYRELAEWNSITNPNLIREGQVLRLRPPATAQARPVTGVAAPAAQPIGGAGDTLKTEPRALRLPYSEENLALITRPAPGGVTASLPAKPEAAKPAAAPVKPEPAAPAAKPAPAAPLDGDDEKIEWGWPAGGRVTAGFSDPANKGVDIAGKKGEPVFASAGGKVVYIGEGLRGYGKLVIVKHNNTYLTAYAHNDAILVKEQQSVVKGQKIAEIGSSGADSTKLHFEIRRSGKPVDPMKYLPPRP
jgi:lipoprotein NlpD